MAPRETRLESMAPARLSAESAARLMEQVEAAQAAPYTPPKAGANAAANPRLVAATQASPVSDARDLSPAAAAEVLKAAAHEGVPFCEVCEKTANSAAAA